MEHDQYLVVKEVAAITRMSKAQVYGLIKEGILASIQLPGCTRLLVAKADLDAYLQAGRRPSSLPLTGERR